MRLVVTCCMVLLAMAGCGSDDERADTETTPTEAATETQTEREPAETEAPKTETEREPPETETEDEPASTQTAETAPISPEDQQGGAGDEEPARSLALLTGRGGRIRPRVVRVPAFISIRIELRSADGGSYGLRLDGRTLRAGGAVASASTVLDGLRPGAAVVGRPLGGGNRVRIEATAEPGP